MHYFQLYHEYVKDTEPPPNFHAWSAIAAISTLLGKKCLIPQGDFSVSPELYIILVGEPGTRKSTAMGVAKSLIKSVDATLLASDCGSREGLMDEMSKNRIARVVGGKELTYWQSSICVDEIGDLLGGEHLDQSMVRFLTTIWGQVLYREATRKSGQIVIHNPYLTLLGCCPTKWVNTKLSQDVITDGLSRRTIFALETELNVTNPWPVRTASKQAILNKLEMEAKRIHDIGGVFTLGKPAFANYCKRYIQTKEEAKKYPDKIQSYMSSRHILALKLAMCISAGVDSTRRVSSEMIDAAFAFLGQSERNLIQVYAGVGRNELKSYAERMLNKIKATGESGLSKAALIKMFYEDLSAAEINEVIDVLQNTKQIECKSITALSAPIFVALDTIPLPPAVDLLPLVSQLTPCAEQLMEGTPSFEQARRLDPATEQLLDYRAHYRALSDSGVLMKGKPSQVSGGSHSP